MKPNNATIDLVKRWEGFKAKAYICPAGVLTVGYGTTNRAGIAGVNITTDTVVTEAQATEWLVKGLEKFGAQIMPAITAPINENEYGAFLSLAYNIGPSAFRESSALRHFNAGDKAKAAAAIKLWDKATVNGKRQTMQGLVNRRADEVRLFQARVQEAMRPPVRVIASLPDNPSPAPSGGFWAKLVKAIVGIIRGRK
jgi:lysozyme